MESLKKKLEDLGIQFTNSYTRGSSYILSDGTFCNLAIQENFSQQRVVAHHVLDRFINDNKLITEEERAQIKEFNDSKGRPYFIIALQERILKYTDGACVINDGTNFNWENCFVDLPEEMPKGKQLDTLIMWLDEMHYKNPSNKRRLEIGLDKKFKTFNLDEDSTDDMIKEIKRLYDERDAAKFK